jgi:hypothetical protein
MVLARLSFRDPPALGTADLSAAAVDHLQRIMDRKWELLLVPSSERAGSGCGDLVELVDWLFLQTGRPETQFRRKCMALFDAFAGRVCHGGKPSTPAKKWVDDRVSMDGVGAIVAIVESEQLSALPAALGDSGAAGVPEVRAAPCVGVAWACLDVASIRCVALVCRSSTGCSGSLPHWMRSTGC